MPLLLKYESRFFQAETITHFFLYGDEHTYLFDKSIYLSVPMFSWDSRKIDKKSTVLDSGDTFERIFTIW